jgi:hypothetical protein
MPKVGTEKMHPAGNCIAEQPSHFSLQADLSASRQRKSRKNQHNKKAPGNQAQ